MPYTTNNKKLKDLIEKWERISRRKFFDADDEDDKMRKILIQHGAMCYFNCANDLREALGCSLFLSLEDISVERIQLALDNALPEDQPM